MSRLLASLLAVLLACTAAAQTSLSAPSADAEVQAWAASQVRGLEGSWTTIVVSVNDRWIDHPVLLASTWTFRDNDLVVRSGDAVHWRFTFKPAPEGRLLALQLLPAPASHQAAGWMLVEREGLDWRFAFHRGFDARPRSFAPSESLLVLSLVRSNELGSRAPKDIKALSKPCVVLYAAGPDRLLNGSVKRGLIEAPMPFPVCKLTGKRGDVTLMLNDMPGADAEFAKHRQSARSATGIAYKQEDDLGWSTFSVDDGARGETVFFSLVGNTFVMLQFWRLEQDPAQLRSFVKRVLATLQAKAT